FSSLPADVKEVTREQLRAVGAQDGDAWMTVAFWDEESVQAVPSVLRVVELLQELVTEPRPACILGRCAPIHAAESDKEEQVATEVSLMLGGSVLADAARFGSYAHRMYQSWSNLSAPEHVSSVVKNAARPAGRRLGDILTSDHAVPIMGKQMRAPYYPCDHGGMPAVAFYPGAVGCTDVSERQGISTPLFNSHTGKYEAPSVVECERALGLEEDSTEVASLSPDERRTLLARATDVTYLSSVLAIYRVMAGQVKGVVPMRSHAAATQACSNGLARSLADSALSKHGGAVIAMASAQTPAAQVEDAKGRDIWDDEQTLHLLRHGVMPQGLSTPEQKRCSRRARLYRFQGDTLYRIEGDAKARVVPRPAERTDIIKRTHEDTGHFGVRRTTGLILTSYWWRGMSEDVAAVVRHCSACDRVSASFNSRAPELNPLPISGLFYRWGVDLCGPFDRTSRGNVYTMICIEHFSKYVVMIPLPDKQAEHTAFAFQQHVLGRYGACAEVCSDQGSEWKGEFAQMLVDSFIDHRQTSASHPQANGLTERAVQTCKNALRRIAQAGGGNQEWDKQLAYIMLGYNCSVQSSSRLAPYHVMHAVEPTIPPAIKERFSEEVNLDDQEMAASSVMQRAAVLRRHMAVAGSNLLIAQHRDTLRYARMRGGAVLPRLRRFDIGDYVYYRNTTARTTLDPQARPEILRVTEVRPTGVLVLEGRCGNTITAHVTHCAPCHLPISDHQVDPRLARPSPSLPCEVCSFPDGEEWMLLCDGCGTGWHTYCLRPPLSHIPEGEWVCPRCEAKGIQVSDLQALGPDPSSGKPLQPPKHLRELQGAAIMREARGRGRRSTAHLGVASYVGRQGRAHRFQVTYDDGVVEVLGVTELRNRLAPKQRAPKSVRASTSQVSSSWGLDSPQQVETAVVQGMPGEHEVYKLSALSTALSLGRIRPCHVTVQEVDVLLGALALEAAGAIFLPFKWHEEVLQQLREAACVFKFLPGKPDLKALEPRALEQAQKDGLGMNVIAVDVGAEVLDLVFPAIVQFAGVVALACVSYSYLSAADYARMRWLLGLRRQGRLAILKMGERMWVMVFSNALWKHALLQDEGSLHELA
ncbi:hypothetical protein Vretifemale_12544, partial [Volvox reticuliferus]